MKYCYRCGEAYTEEACPVCGTTLYTDKPNTQTKKKERAKKGK